MPIPLPEDFPFRPDEPFTRRQAQEAGVPDWVLHRLVKEHRLRRPIHKVYVGAAAPDSLELRCRALGLVLPSDGFICDLTAAWIHAGEKALAPGDHATVPSVSCFRPSEGGRLRNAITSSGERMVGPRDLVEIQGLVVTTQLRTAVDLGRLQRTADMRLWGMACMLSLGDFTHDELCIETDRFKGQRGVVLQRELVPRVDPGLESFGEAAMLNRWWDAGLPRPHTQVEIVRDDGSSYFLDLGLPEERFAAEYDGRAWHSTDEQREHDRGRRQWVRDRRGWRIEVLTETNTFGHAQNAELILREALAGHRGVRYL
ncbi:type IV toxin-antitoxin system AbiEi family antitoxin domain-containing protein [Nocardioides sp. W7]|uniref:type IV toxin-antitoxin system AbiEi family antitoxin domain-containing protein n=1 Tax=Nocardioides sp. W7 TaxID=2931390 RepID=UPI001FD221FE|nr:type IV toxin-antitoxin system AbiEi family antitoxin domain-containing protein [Nocardioides sp. W7]